MTDILLDITPFNWAPPKDREHQLATFAAARRFFPEATRVEINQWRRLVVIIPDPNERQRAAMRAIYAADLQQYRETLDETEDGFAGERRLVIDSVLPEHLGVRDVAPEATVEEVLPMTPEEAAAHAAERLMGAEPGELGEAARGAMSGTARPHRGAQVEPEEFNFGVINTVSGLRAATDKLLAAVERRKRESVAGGTDSAPKERAPE